LPLEHLIDAQFELFQFTVSTSGLAGASPRNRDRGKTAFVEGRDGKTCILIPYYPGNAVHGHAAKLWSNSYGSFLAHDETTTGVALTISGPSRVFSHEATLREFPASTERVATIPHRNGSAMPPLIPARSRRDRIAAGNARSLRARPCASDMRDRPRLRCVSCGARPADVRPDWLQYRAHGMGWE
jgi:hypothetical protein